jgi:hypothetical protein
MLALIDRAVVCKVRMLEYVQGIKCIDALPKGWRCDYNAIDERKC